MSQNDFQVIFEKALKEAGITEEYLLQKTNEWIDAIKTGKFKPKNKEKELKELEVVKRILIFRIKQQQEG